MAEGDGGEDAAGAAPESLEASGSSEDL
jgi:hypothetical protein